MGTTAESGRYEVVVIGGGQTGLALGYHLARMGIDFVILDAHDRVGDQWAGRYRSLRLYSPARFDALPGLAMSLPGSAFPTGQQMATYLATYATHFRLPVQSGVRVDGLDSAGPGRDRFVVTAGPRRYEADQVVVATGAFQAPHVPDFARDLDPAIHQFHSSEYLDPTQLADGPVLVVGASHSGADLAFEAAANHHTILSGRIHGQLPFSVDSRVGRIGWPMMRFIAARLLTLDTPIGRKMAPEVRKGGGPLLRVRRGDLARAGVEWVESRTVGARGGKPVLADDRVLDVANVIWCTGFRPDYAWIHLPFMDDEGWPRQTRGVVDSVPGLYFLGLPFLYSFTSMLVTGAGRDAGYVSERITARAKAAQTALRQGPAVSRAS